MEHDPDTGLLEIKQEGVTLCVIEAIGLDLGAVTPKWTPAEAAPLIKDAEGAPATGAFSYSSVVGMLLYLSGHTHPDTLYMQSIVQLSTCSVPRNHMRKH
jgi:hypothetical protein